MGIQKERKSIFLTAFEHREKGARSLFVALTILHNAYHKLYNGYLQNKATLA